MDYLQTAAHRQQERVNAWTHGLGLALAAVGVPLLLYHSDATADT